jgi:predicted site-specific integrase-resolvase
LLEQQGRRVAVVNLAEAVNLAENEREDLVADVVADLVALVDSFCARLSGPRRAKHKTENRVRALTREEARVADEQEQEVAEDATG